MILSKVANYLKLNRRGALQDMALILKISPDALRAMLRRLESSGKVRRLAPGTSCGSGCRKCKPHEVELFEWCG